MSRLVGSTPNPFILVCDTYIQNQQCIGRANRSKTKVEIRKQKIRRIQSLTSFLV
jgi:hypothetical protein